ncbi:glutamine-hydrolyzing carbamoyl-phosphate synthase small subunit [Bordetella bronchiseptica]|uniref:glutamine-hydrolyzing carbamoyl-phosphate synthase small subunit n=1 Tax=Bordetella bronchiseptica TaxID=518 RepID=UPI0002F28150|nr:carbamoyl-phosphate synthase, small subunit [Bordetella bronchiseptica 00-P-2730]KCV55441.1 carbamoyl-phosphate synthase, small subunit [Bordetella bronchiseptica 7E71]KDC60633.1 carbamoyl-phosphate synthase, small subunit [Bordetella bronchiseptica MBORD591]KDD00185.1 carbamoyl-phosphate synthase, small subunit [Bordetella bronchiseptica MBORD675]KDD09923.1 carbamoyl-phosphate synthase, small subunit [Bordetella bronchiseptica MBORD707]KDD49841.1 carbamoyl-phosphate synthase, small subunit
MLPQLFPEGINRFPPAILALADGTIFRGVSIGAPGHTVAEVVFNTSMTGYQEILTDPSYAGQTVMLTYPHIGNTGVNPEDVEANRVYAAGLVVRDCPARVSNFRATQSLPEYLNAQGIVAIAGIDTRKLTRILRESGAQGSCILVGEDAERAVELARGFPGMSGQDLAKVVSIKERADWTQGTWELGSGYTQPAQDRFHVVAYDYGVKSNILRLLADRGCRVTLVPAQTTAEEAFKLQPDGVFLSNGPGDPEPCDYAVDATRAFLERKLPVFGICLGHQLMGLALGGKTIKMKTGHHGANHPVQDVQSGRVFITSQNHGFAVDAATLPANTRVTHISLFDGTLQGFELTDRPAFCFQGHPEASPGPHDIIVLFDKFISLMAGQK